MKRGLRRALAAALLVALAAAAPAYASDDADATTVVGAGSPANAAHVAAALRREHLHVSVIPRIGAMQVSGAEIGEVRRLVGGDPRVTFVEPSRTRTLFVTLDSTIDALTGRAYGWALDTVNASEGLALAPPTLPVKVAVVDSGVNVGHPDLAGRIGPTYDVLTGGTAVKDLVGHGTFVTGLISAIDGNSLGSRGVAGATTVLPIRITTTGTIKSADAAAGIVRGVNAGAGVINLSFGGTTISDVEKSALAYAASKDVLVVAAAGNAYGNGNPLQYPAASIGGVRGGWSQGLSVAATDPVGRHAPFSTANDFVSVAAPGAGSGTCGDGVFSTLPANTASLWDGPNASSCMRVVGSLSTATGRWGYGEGTSFAAPLVSGAAALARDANPRLTAEQTADVIRRSAHQTIGSGWNSMTGTGVLDVGAAVALARVYDTEEPRADFDFTPVVGSVSVDLHAEDEGADGGSPSGVASVRVERSTDGGATWTTLQGGGKSNWHYDEGAAPAAKRIFRATVCDANHNCETESGTTSVQPLSQPARPMISLLRPRLATLGLTRPAGCGACVRVVFAAKGAGRIGWSVTLISHGAGVKMVRRAGTVLAGRLLSVRLPLSRIPLCRGRITVTTRLSTSAGSVRGTRTLSVRRSCRPIHHR